MTTHNPLQQLCDLDRTSARFHKQLRKLIRGHVYKSALPSLQRENTAWLVEYLNSVLVDVSDHDSPMFQEFLHELRNICGIKEVLPGSCTLPESLLGCVYEGTFDGSKVRIRRVRACPGGDTQKAKEIFHQLVVTSKHLTHPNIVPLLGVTAAPPELISEWMPGGDLPGYISMHPDADRLSLLSDVAKGLRYLHSCDVIHGDLKGSNVLVDVTGHARITDFGLALFTQDLVSIRSTSAEYGQTARWIAPEILEDRGTYSKQADVFSFAGVTIEAFTGAAPFDDKPPHEARLAVMRGGRPLRPTHPTLTDGVWSLIKSCWDVDPNLRPRALWISCSFGNPAWQRLINSPLTSDERVSLITDILSDRDETEMVKGLSGDDAQSFVDVVDKMLDNLGPQLRRKCLKVLRKICGHEILLPRSLHIPLCFDRSEGPLYTGGYADVWMSEHQGTKVAVKVLKVMSSNLRKVRSRFCKEVITWRSLCHPNVLSLLGVTMSNARWGMISEWMDNGNINEFLEVHRNADRFNLLEDVTRGLIYMHDQAMIHGDLKGANILIDRNCHALLADFGLLTFVLDPAHSAASNSTTDFGGSTRWMSPELLHPELFGFEDGRPTKESDCYALGMVILEVLSGQAPFAGDKVVIVMRKVLDGEHPIRPEEAWFTGDLWETLEQCWSSQPEIRPAVEAVLNILGRASYDQGQQRLITRSFSKDELPFLLETVFLNKESKSSVRRLQGGTAQALVDILDEALENPDDLPSNIQSECMQSLREMCAHYALFPNSLRIELRDDRPDVTLHRGEFGEVLKHKYQGRDVAVKMLKTYTTSDLQTIVQRFCKELASWKAPRHPNVLPIIGVIVTEIEFAMVSEWMSNGNINQFVAKHGDANRFKLLSDVAKGLTYMHNQGLIHGHLKGANILVDQTERACLADFGLPKVLSGLRISKSYKWNDTIRWMSPELLDPEIQDHRWTNHSDCYGLGMVIYEVLSTRVPFHQYEHASILEKVIEGDRPMRPEGVEGVWFTDDIWEVLECCWVLTPQTRPSADDVLLCLEKTSNSWIPAPSFVKRFSPQNTRVQSDAKRMDPIQVLRHLGTSPPQFSEQLNGTLTRGDLDESVQGFGAKDLEEIEDLDKALNDLPPASDAFKQIHSRLQGICASRGLLPLSYGFSGAIYLVNDPFYWGGFSEVFEGIYDGSKVCVKKLRVASHSDSKNVTKVLCRQALIWKRLKHSNIVPFIGATIDPLQIASEWMPNGDLQTHVNSNPSINRVDLLVDIASGLEYLHSLDVVHGDLKGPNILIDASGRARITDFDLAQHISGEPLKSEGQSARWTAPEVLDEAGTLSPAADVFSFAMVMIEVFTGKIPFHDERIMPVIRDIMHGERPPRPSHPTFTNGLWELTQKCWNQDPSDRPQMPGVLAVLNNFPSPTQHGELESLDAKDAYSMSESPGQWSPATRYTLIPGSTTQGQPKEHKFYSGEPDLSNNSIELTGQILGHTPPSDRDREASNSAGFSRGSIPSRSGKRAKNGIGPMIGRVRRSVVTEVKTAFKRDKKGKSTKDA